jgi:YcaO-like protein with predicted kinase domain
MEHYRRTGPSAPVALARLLGMRRSLGITRVGDVTGLDRLGMPVMQAVRPFSLSNAVSQGKGADQAAAAVSAMLESAEGFFAERVSRFHAIAASAETLGLPADRFAAYLLDGVATGWHAEETAWVMAESLTGGEPAPVPLELVHTAYVEPPIAPDGLFAATTTGLAVAFTEEDAVAHAILEVIERDAIARAHRVHGFFQKRRIHPASVRDPSVRALLEELRGKGMLVGLWHAPSPTDAPVVWCQLMEREEDGSASLPYAADGWAASLDPAAAASQAIYEAAQTRLAAISGARDDMTRAAYPRYPDLALLSAHRRLLVQDFGPIDLGRLGEGGCAEREPVPVLLAALTAAGIHDAFLVRLDTAPLAGLAAVKILIPDLLPLLDG